MTFLGFKLSRWRQWLTVLRLERARLTPMLLLRMIWQARLFRKVDRRTWRARLRVCRRCMIYDRENRRCRLDDLGCGCYVPLSARLPDGCWAWERNPRQGWPPVESDGRSK